jgi:hypothetical protein
MQETPASAGGILSATGKEWEADLGPNSVRYVYRGSAPLEDVTATVTVYLTDGGKLSYERAWGIWEPGEVKEVNLFLAGVRPVERLDFTATGTREGKKVTASLVTRR